MLLFVKKNLPGILWSLLTLFVSTLPGKDVPSFDIVNFDKFAHFIFYALFYWMVLWGVFRNYNLSSVKVQVICITFPILYGILMEIIQGTLIDQRVFDFYDALANSFGVVFAAISFLTVPFLKQLFTRS